MKIKSAKNKFALYSGRFFVFLGIFVIVLTICFDCWFRPVIERLVEYRCKLIADKAVSRAICKHLDTTENDYSDIVSFVYEEDGKIGALRTNPAKINTMKAGIMEQANKELTELGEEEFGIALGSLTGVSYLYGTGAELVFSLKPTGVARSRLLSRFESTGINQTMHSVILVIYTEVSPLVPGLSDSFIVENEFVISQTILMGDIPDTFSNIVLDEEHYSELADFDLTG